MGKYTISIHRQGINSVSELFLSFFLFLLGRFTLIQFMIISGFSKKNYDTKISHLFIQSRPCDVFPNTSRLAPISAFRSGIRAVASPQLAHADIISSGNCLDSADRYADR